ncbi:hypothetical protein C8Q75DRAFT_720689 [Abortiporus biennis]|nr:hypothetical protein C8Q75DRAFT_720689 [Abortiporus biennis]
MGTLSFDPPTPLTPTLAVFNSFQITTRKSRQFWQRTTFLALFALLAITGYVFLIARPSLASISLGDSDSQSTSAKSGTLARLSTQANRLAALRHKKPKTASQATETASLTQLSLTPAQELAAVTSFIASLDPQNVIPAHVDPSLPLDPQLVLDFDTQSPNAASEVDALVNDTWVRYPVVLFSRVHSPVSRELKQMITAMNLLPSPTIIDVDERSDEAVLTPILHRLTRSTDLPILLVGGQKAGSTTEIRYLNAKGELQRMISKAGAVVDGGKKKKGRKH